MSELGTLASYQIMVWAGSTTPLGGQNYQTPNLNSPLLHILY